MPDSVGYIGHNAFWGCRSLEKMTLPFIGREKNPDKNSVTVFGVIFGSGHHSGCVETKQYSSQTGDFTSYIPEGLKSVTITGGKIFYGEKMSRKKSQTGRRQLPLPVLRLLSVVGLAADRLPGDGIQLAPGLPLG